MKYSATVTAIGEIAYDLYDSNGCLIIFNNNAPEGLAEISILHDINELQEEVQVGDTLVFAGQEFPITFVGDEANHTLRTLGHCTFVFREGDDPLPGQIVVEANTAPKQIEIGDTIAIK